MPKLCAPVQVDEFTLTAVALAIIPLFVVVAGTFAHPAIRTVGARITVVKAGAWAAVVAQSVAAEEARFEAHAHVAVDVTRFPCLIPETLPVGPLIADRLFRQDCAVDADFSLARFAWPTVCAVRSQDAEGIVGTVTAIIAETVSVKRARMRAKRLGGFRRVTPRATIFAVRPQCASAEGSARASIVAELVAREFAGLGTSVGRLCGCVRVAIVLSRPNTRRSARSVGTRHPLQRERRVFAFAVGHFVGVRLALLRATGPALRLLRRVYSTSALRVLIALA